MTVAVTVMKPVPRFMVWPLIEKVTANPGGSPGLTAPVSQSTVCAVIVVSSGGRVVGGVLVVGGLVDVVEALVGGCDVELLDAAGSVVVLASGGSVAGGSAAVGSVVPGALDSGVLEVATVEAADVEGLVAVAGGLVVVDVVVAG